MIKKKPEGTREVPSGFYQAAYSKNGSGLTSFSL